jgi:hypothetical protein
MNLPRTVECDFRLANIRRKKSPVASSSGSQVPRVARLMALAIRMESLVRAADIADYSAIAQLGHVSRARITQIMNLLLLAPDIQEQILFLASPERGRNAIRLAQLQPIAQVADWRRQRVLWATMSGHCVLEKPSVSV